MKVKKASRRRDYTVPHNEYIFKPVDFCINELNHVLCVDLEEMETLMKAGCS